MTLILPGQDLTEDIVNGLEHGAWTSYTPTMGSATGSPTLGNATVTGAYQQVGKRVHVVVKINVGTTTNFGTSVTTFALPVAPSTNAADSVLGLAYIQDTSVPTRRCAVAVIDGSNTRVFLLADNNGGFVAAAGPWTWASTDVIRFSGTYEAA